MKDKPTLLVAEDEQINRKILKRILREEYNVLEADNGAQAWDILSNQKIKLDGVLTDLIMPVMDGYALLAKMRQASMTEMPVLVLTGETNAETEQRVLDAGAWDFVSKPYNARILLSRLRNAMARRQVAVFEQMQRMAAHDPLTGLHNRSRMFEKTRQMLDANPGTTFAFFRADIDHFALYNTAFGEEEGDKLICYLAKLFTNVAARFKLCTFGRITADIFCACVQYRGDDHALRALVEELEKNLETYRKDYRLEVSVGVYVIDDPSVSVEEMYVRATMGAQKCKRQYGEHIGYYDADAGKRAAEELAITNEMETALQERQFLVYLQPKVRIATDRACGAEALVRWKHPTRGLISPGLFIPVFEGNGFIARLDYYVWDTTCRMLRGWLDADQEPEPISVNISRISLYNPKLVDDLVHLIQKHRIPARLLQLEITESAYMTNPDLMQDTIRSLRQAGFTILMDDFGSGYSSLNTLKDIEVDILKIDMNFLPVGKDVERAEIILASMIKMANWLGMSVVVEGVETQNQRDFLESTSCDYIQGYFYSRPIPQEEYEQKYVFSDMVFDYGGKLITAEESALTLSSTVLIVDDQEIDRSILEGYLRGHYLTHGCASAEEAMLYLQRNRGRVRLILLDNIMPGMSGLDFLTFCQDDASLRNIPQIMITSADNVEDQALAFRRGAYDYIAKPLYKEVVLARVNHVMEVSRLYRVFETSELHFRDAAQRDQSTGLLNKTAFIEIASRYLENYREDSQALLVLDFDNFKDVNDQYGHIQGDSILRTVADVLTKAFRKVDLVGRFGGDEFMVMMTNLPNQEIVRRKAGEIIKNIAITCSRTDHINASVSVGVAFQESNDSIERMFARADQALYEAKTSGKNKAVVYGEHVPPVVDDDKPIILICGEDPQLYPAVALSYGETAAFLNITSLAQLKEALEKYPTRISAVCLDTQQKGKADSDEFYQALLQHGCGDKIPLLAVYKEGDIDNLRSALELQVQDVISMPPQIDSIQRKLSRAILAGCV